MASAWRPWQALCLYSKPGRRRAWRGKLSGKAGAWRAQAKNAGTGAAFSFSDIKHEGGLSEGDGIASGDGEKNKSGGGMRR